MIYAHEHKEIVRLYRDGMTLLSIADWLGCTPEEVRQHLISKGS